PLGFINLVLKRPLPDSAVTLKATANSWPGYRSEIDATSALNNNGSVRGRIAVSYDDSDSFVDELESEKKTLYATLEWDLAKDTTLSIGSTLEKTDDTPYVGVPTYADGRFGDFSRELYTGSPFNYKESDVSRQFVELAHRFQSGAEAVLTLNNMHRDFAYLLNYTVSPIDPDTGEVTRWALQTDQELSEFSVDAHLNLPYALFDREHKLLIGVDSRDADDKTDGYAIDFAYPPINVFNPDSASNPDPRETMQQFRGPSQRDTKETGLYFKSTSHITDATQVIPAVDSPIGRPMTARKSSRWRTSSRRILA
ncbi:MAG TPA: hypothetical protein DD979_02175, partial [Gammaproteobacteria bacterium]|nr:hypothetical protein [Gammaproteobacteria bacterium]